MILKFVDLIENYNSESLKNFLEDSKYQCLKDIFDIV